MKGGDVANGAPASGAPTTGALRQYAAACSASLLVMTTGCWLGWPSPAIPKLEHNQTSVIVTPDEISWIVSLMDAGSAVSPVPAGFLMDIFGRKVVLLLTGLLFTATWVLALLAQSPSLLYVARFLAGVGKGVAFTVVPMYLGEIASTGIRGAVSTMFAGLLWAGTMFVFTVGPAASYNLLLILSLSIPVAFLTTFLFMPESPYYLVMKERHEDAERSLNWLRKCGHDTSSREGGSANTVVQELKDIQKTVREDMRNRRSFGDLISSRGNRKATTIVIIISMFQRTCGISPLLAYSSTTLPQTGSFIGRSQIIVVFGFILTVSNFLVTPLVDRLGRKPLLILSGAGCALATGITSVFYFLNHNTAVDVTGFVWVPYLCICLFGLTHSIGIGVIPHTLVGELYSQNVKCYAAAMASITFALSSFAINKVYIAVCSQVGVYAMFAFFSLNGLVCALFSYFVIFETKGKTFAEIQAVLRERL